MSEDGKMPKWLVLLWIAAIVGIVTYVVTNINYPPTP